MYNVYGETTIVSRSTSSFIHTYADLNHNVLVSIVLPPILGAREERIEKLNFSNKNVNINMSFETVNYLG